MMPQNRNQANKGQFTGKHLAAIFVIGFGIVAAVNFFMASRAIGGFHGIVVDNSYIASQKFNGWLDEAEKSRALGWEAKASRDETGFVELETQSVPEGAVITARLRRPLGEREYADLTFTEVGEGRFRSDTPLKPGRWSIRLTIDAQGQVWSEESELR